MKRVLILTFVAILAITMASCDWDPTGIGTGGGGTGSGNDGGGRGGDSTKVDRDHDKKDRDGVMMVRGMEGDVITTPCDYTFEIQSITVTENTNDAVTDRKTDRTVLVQILVTYADGSVEAFTLTNEAPSVTVGDCTIHLKGVKPYISTASDRATYVAHFAITTG